MCTEKCLVYDILARQVHLQYIWPQWNSVVKIYPHVQTIRAGIHAWADR